MSLSRLGTASTAEEHPDSEQHPSHYSEERTMYRSDDTSDDIDVTPNPLQSDSGPVNTSSAMGSELGDVEPQSGSSPGSISNMSVARSEAGDLGFGYITRFSPWFPKVDPEYHQAQGIRSWRIWRSKRHVVLWTAFVSSLVVLLTNILLVVVLGSKYGVSSGRGLIKLYVGDCNRVKMIGISSHVGINILSTLLLGASNLCMQLLVAPTREEIDAAHRRKIWLDIGIPSWKNIMNIRRSRRWLFLFLLLSSIPLHFM
jgi:hypothetical protein